MVAISPTESADKTGPEKSIAFRWTYIVVPAALLLLSIILAISFYSTLPPEVAYHFKDGSPDGWMNRGAIIAWMIIPQFVFVVLGIIISGIATTLSKRFSPADSPQVKKVLSIMGNMVALPQIILTFAMLDIFLYNAYRIHLIPLWVFALIIMALGGIILGIFFIQTLWQSYRLTGKSLQE